MSPSCAAISSGSGSARATAASSAASPGRHRAAPPAAGLVLALSLTLAGCASSDHPCRTGRTGGWLSGWGGGGGSSVAVGLHRTWRECPEPAPATSPTPR